MNQAPTRSRDTTNEAAAAPTYAAVLHPDQPKSFSEEHPATWATFLALGITGVLVGLEWLMGHPEAMRQLYIMPLWIAVRLGGRPVAITLLLGICALHTATDFYVLGHAGQQLWLSSALRLIGFGAVLILIQQVESALERSQQLAMYDPLTGVLNRRALIQFSQYGIGRAKRSRAGLAVMLIDCDNFKAINDQHGHEMGDRILRTLARVLESETRHGDIVARIGGDEFVVVLQDVSDHAAAAFHLRVSAAFRDATSFVGEPVSVSVGPAFLGEDGSTIDELLASADRSMYRLKGKAKERAQAVVSLE